MFDPTELAKSYLDAARKIRLEADEILRPVQAEPPDFRPAAPKLHGQAHIFAERLAEDLLNYAAPQPWTLRADKKHLNFWIVDDAGREIAKITSSETDAMLIVQAVNNYGALSMAEAYRADAVAALMQKEREVARLRKQLEALTEEAQSGD